MKKNAAICLSLHGTMEGMLPMLNNDIIERLPTLLIINKYSKRYGKVFLLSHDKKKINNIFPNNVKQIRFFNQMLYLLFGWLILLFLVIKYKINTVLIECGPALHNTFLINKLTKAKIILHYDNTFYLTTFNKYKRKIIFFFENFLLNFVDYYIAGNSDIKKLVGKRAIRIPVQKGIVLNPFSNAKKNKIYKKIRKGYNIIYVGRLAEEKDPITLIKAFNLVSKEYTHLNLIICGDGPLLTKCKSIANENVHFLGFVSDIPGMLKGADMYVLPSLYDASPKALIEAMVMGKTIIATRVGGVDDFIDNKCGFLIKSGDEKILADKIKFCLQNKKRVENMRKECIKRAYKFHDLDKNMDYILDYIER